MKTEQYKNLRIVFMGTPEFAVASLQHILEAGCQVVAVITAPDKPGGRGMELQQSAVKKFALQKNLPVLQPEKLRNEAFLNQLRSFEADLQICVAFRMLPEVVWNMPPLGTINVHGSLLPQYRGAAPINWAVINGEKETGVTTFKLKHQIDTGNILLQQSFSIDPEDSAGTIHDRMMMVGAQLLLQTIKGLADGILTEQPQHQVTETALRHAPKIFTDTCKIDPNQPAEQVYNLIRGLSPYPAAFTFLDNKKLKIFKTKILHQPPGIPAGSFDTDGKSFLHLACADEYLQLIDLQLEGKKRMTIEEFLRGYRF
ncbi:MAG TPA: methionyl-tRNA formyltransferase [Niabella sp.]|nr:methionyl-tRNA formyltransferase [Niabella sp.]HRB41463.1 methionyl-tRNA formyltransferase [Niabella sp.]HRB61248.1 methionyl-tRNA formyltransferase [Niabella sp.]